jgi:3-oxoacyl-[acyl-carrier protein] reductase
VERKHEVLEMTDQIARTFGRIDYLVNNARVVRPALLKDMTEEEWDTVVDINLKGAFLCSQAAMQYMIKNGFGRIVNVCSVAFFRGQEARGNYSASKAGLMALTRVMALELARYNIRANAVAPGLVDTEIIRKNVPTNFLEEVILDHKPLGRLGQAREVAEVILFLLSEGSSYMTGETVVVDGGLLSGYFHSNKRFGESFFRKKDRTSDL